MQPNKIIELFIQDVAVELTDEFDRNFERKAFFDEAWPAEKMKNSRGSQMARTGTLRASINQTVLDSIITWQSSLPYASIHNTGGEITVTANMKKFFWAMFYKNGGKGAKESELTAEAKQWRSLALKKVGDILKMPKRQFIGEHPQVHGVIQDVFNDMEDELNEYVLNHLKR
ncbi:MAG TPA: phage virion morphogenesis protein [Flavobacteriaceae bacterium]|nr:phage virion morphogenesis protein [Flavobacteriaceae bacterium]